MAPPSADTARVTQEPGPNPDTSAKRVAFRSDLFAVLWAAAALFHLAGDQRPGWMPPTATLTVIQLGLILAAAAVLLGWRRRSALLVLCLLIPVSAWFEAPVVGNHWVLAAMVSLAYVVAVAVSARSREGAAGTWRRFAPAARLTVAVAYAFAAFAKLNTDFFDPAVSCAVFYSDQLVQSWGLGGLSVAGRPGLGVATAVAAATVELSVAALLVIPRTRRWALLVALPFHWLLAMDFSQHFWDFSSVLFAGFLLFADDATIDAVSERLTWLGTAVRPAVARGTAVLAALVVALVAGAVLAPALPAVRGLAVVGGHAVWVVAGTTAAAIVVLSVLRTRPSARPQTLRPAGIVLVVPVLAILNGLTPYLEVKTGFGWNMYSNLRTVAGESNHLLVRSTLDMAGLQNDRVQILDASDKGLAPLIGSDFEVVYSEFREYAHSFPDASVTYRRGAQTFDATRLAEDPAGRGGVSAFSHRLQSFRVVDASGSERCQAVFTPAR